MKACNGRGLEPPGLGSAAKLSGSTASLLLVEDDAHVRRALRTTLTSAGYIIVEARTGEEALEEVADSAVDVVLLDLKLPGISGLQVCRGIRETSDLPVLVISASRTQEEKVQAFNEGADDYLVKPFSIQELLSRLHALRRRFSGRDEHGPLFESAELSIDFRRRRVIVSGQTIHLAPSEFELLRHLVLHEGKPVSHGTLFRLLWGPGEMPEVTRLRVAINQLRRKLELQPARIRYIHTEHHFGYRFEPMLQEFAESKQSK